MTTHKPSSKKDFIERPLLPEEDIKKFEAAINHFGRSARRQNGDELLEIYEDDQGRVVDVKKISIRRRPSRLARLLKILVWILVLAGLAYGAYFYYLKFYSGKSKLLEISIDAPAKIKSGEEFFYTVKYKNNASLSLKNIKVELIYPDNFVYMDSLPLPSQNKNSWAVVDLPAGATGEIKIKGQIIGESGQDNILTVKANYYLDKFSTEFRHEFSAVTLIDGLGFVINSDYSNTALIGQDNEINLSFKDFEELFVPSSLILSAELSDNVSDFSPVPVKNSNTATSSLSFAKIADHSWQITGFTKDTASQVLRIVYRLKDKLEPQEKIVLKLEVLGSDNLPHTLWREELSLNVVKSNLNLSLDVNGQKGDSAINFGETLSYNISYTNNDNVALKDVVITAVLDGEAINWETLKDKFKGERRSGNSISWSKNEVPELAELAPGSTGRIYFSVNAVTYQQNVLGKNLQVQSYGQFGVGVETPDSQALDNKSNVIINKINSDFNFKDRILYFNEDNIPVGSGPLPPKFGQTTSLRVYWSINNNLHELSNTQVVYDLPEGVNYGGQDNVSVGSISYDSTLRRITWEIGSLPLSTYQASAEFNISITPQSADRNRIMMLSNGVRATATDIETQASLEKSTTPQTTRLEDDDIAALSNDGVVR